MGNSGWHDFEAHYSYSLDNEYEVWELSGPCFGKQFQFAVRYEVNGNTYWDNNYGQDYIITSKNERNW